MIIIMIFHMWTTKFHKISFRYFEDYLMTKLPLGFRVWGIHDDNLVLSPIT
jgi:hypothetical protein